MRRRLPATLIAAAMAVTACSSPDAGTGGPDGVLIRIDEVGGFLPFELALTAGPSFTLTTDGRLFTPGAVPAIYPGPLVYPYFVSQITPGHLGQIQTMIERIGLPDMDDVVEDTASDFLADAGTTVITYWDSNGEHRFSVYALGFADRASQAAKDFAELRDVLQELSWRNEPTDYEPERFRVVAGQGMLDVDEDFVDVRPWPLPDTDLSSWSLVEHGWVCRAFGVEFLDQFLNASQVTRWTNPSQGSEDLTLYVRLLLPGEDNCP